LGLRWRLWHCSSVQLSFYTADGKTTTICTEFTARALGCWFFNQSCVLLICLFTSGRYRVEKAPVCPNTVTTVALHSGEARK
jgi:hypothetical protein